MCGSVSGTVADAARPSGLNSVLPQDASVPCGPQARLCRTLAKAAACGERREAGKSASLWALLLVIAFAAILVLAATPGSAFAKDYSCPQVAISAAVDESATLHVREQRVFDFDGDFTAIWWELGENLPVDASIVISGVSMSENTGGEPQWQPLQEVPFESRWRDAGGPQTVPAWSYDEVFNTVYAFFDVSDEKVAFQLEYSVLNGVRVYNDVAELYWQFVGSGWAVSSSNVEASISLPVPAGEEVVAGDTVRAWGHGPLDAQVAIQPSGVVDFDVPRVPAGDYAEARITFPATWVSAVDPTVTYGYDYLDSILSEEQQWADEANARRTASRLLLFGMGGLCLVSIIAALVCFFLFGREYKPQFSDDYWRDVPEPGMQPAVVGRLLHWGTSDTKDLIATIMSLSQKGVLRIDAVQHPDERGRIIDDYQITLLPAAQQVTDPIEKATLDFLFRSVPGRPDVRWMDEITHYGESSPRSYIAAVSRWQKVLEREVKREGFFEQRGTFLAGVFSLWGALLLFGGVWLCVMSENFWPGIMGFVSAVIIIPLSINMRRRSRRANEITARCKALKRWLQDFSRIDERPPTDVKVWGQLMVYAYLLGVAKQAIKELQRVMPEMFDDSAYDGSGGIPWWYWYSRPMGYHSTMSFADALDRSVANTLSSATAAVSPSSSGSGGGGGFSVGGGGGFGGGGGAR